MRAVLDERTRVVTEPPTTHKVRMGFWGALATWYYRAWCCIPRAGHPQHLLLQVYMVAVAFAGGMGGVILAGGPPRFSSPSLDGPRQIAHLVMPVLDPFHTWAVLFLIGALALIGTIGRSGAYYSLAFNGVLNFFFALSFGLSLFVQPLASGLGVVIFTAFALLHIVLASHVKVHGWR